MQQNIGSEMVIKNARMEDNSQIRALTEEVDKLKKMLKMERLDRKAMLQN
jgi:hypothetical protein